MLIRIVLAGFVLASFPAGAQYSEKVGIITSLTGSEQPSALSSITARPRAFETAGVTFGQAFRTESGPRQNSGWEVLPIWEN